MLSRRLLFALSGAAALTTAAARAQSRNSGLSRLWTGLEFMDSEGQRFGLADIRQPLKVVQLWANWCPACLGEMSSLVSLAKNLGEQRAQVLLVSNPEDWRRDQLAAQRLKLPFRLATLSPNNSSTDTRAALLNEQGAFVVPRSFVFLGTQNTLAMQHLGTANWADEGARLKARVG